MRAKLKSWHLENDVRLFSSRSQRRFRQRSPWLVHVRGRRAVVVPAQRDAPQSNSGRHQQRWVLSSSTGDLQWCRTLENKSTTYRLHRIGRRILQTETVSRRLSHRLSEQWFTLATIRVRNSDLRKMKISLSKSALAAQRLGTRHRLSLNIAERWVRNIFRLSKWGFPLLERDLVNWPHNLAQCLKLIKRRNTSWRQTYCGSVRGNIL